MPLTGNNELDSTPYAPDERSIILRWQRSIASRGGSNRTYEARSAQGKLYAAQVWRTRRARYGPSGLRQKPYSEWRKTHGLKPIDLS